MASRSAGIRVNNIWLSGIRHRLGRWASRRLYMKKLDLEIKNWMPWIEDLGEVRC